MLGGEISVTSEPGKGTNFTVWLQTEFVDNEADPPPESSTVIDLTKNRLQLDGDGDKRTFDTGDRFTRKQQ
jgi:hypothetical protein